MHVKDKNVYFVLYITGTGDKGMDSRDKKKEKKLGTDK